MKIFRLTAAVLFFLLVAADGGDAADAADAVDGRPLRLATTTSTENSGLLDFILPDFEARGGCVVHVIAVGTGRALRLGENGDVDVLLVHSPPDEAEFVRRGFGLRRTTFMRNDFVLVGPAADPAGIVGDKDAAAAFARIARARAPFVSRGDESGTHKKEKSLWRAAQQRFANNDSVDDSVDNSVDDSVDESVGDNAPSGVGAGGGEGGGENVIMFSPDWHISAGAGMGAALLLADQKRAYVLSDRGTFIAFRDKLDLTVVVENDPPLDNPYSVIVLNPAAHAHVNYECALAFEEWTRSSTAREKIAAFRFHGEQLFFPEPLLLEDD